MKLKLFIIGLLLLALGSFELRAQNQMFEKFSNNKDITMAGKMDLGGANIKGLVGKLEKMEIYNSENKSAVAVMKAETDKLSKDKSFEVLMTVKEKDQNVTFYAQKDRGDRFKDLIMCITEADECSIIRIMGSFTMEDIQSVIDGKK